MLERHTLARRRCSLGLQHDNYRPNLAYDISLVTRDRNEKYSSGAIQLTTLTLLMLTMLRLRNS